MTSVVAAPRPDRMPSPQPATATATTSSSNSDSDSADHSAKGIHAANQHQRAEAESSWGLQQQRKRRRLPAFVGLLCLLHSTVMARSAGDPGDAAHRVLFPRNSPTTSPRLSAPSHDSATRWYIDCRLCVHTYVLTDHDLGKLRPFDY